MASQALCGQRMCRIARHHHRQPVMRNVYGMTCDFQQCGILTSVVSLEPVQPPFKLRNSK